MLKQVLSVAAGLGIALAVFAADVELKPGHPDTYVVVKGDTLWDISGKFLSKPWLWPEIWQANPQVVNPHLIYPGDKLSLVYLDGKARVMLGDSPRGPSGPRVRATQLGDALTSVPLGRVLPFLEKVRVVDKAQLEAMPYVVALEEQRLLGAAGQTAYVRGLNVAGGTKVTVLRAVQEYYAREIHDGADQRERHISTQSLQDDPSWKRPTWYWAWSWATGSRADALGIEMLEVGGGEVLRGGDPSTLLVQFSDVEIRKGDRVVVGGAVPYDLTFFPRAPERIPANLHIVSLTDALATAGPYQVVAISAGSRDGMAVGDTFSIFRPGEMVTDEVKYPEGHVRRAILPGSTQVRLPDEFVGHVMIFRSFERISYALVMDAIRPVHSSDALRAPG